MTITDEQRENRNLAYSYKNNYEPYMPRPSLEVEVSQLRFDKIKQYLEENPYWLLHEPNLDKWEAYIKRRVALPDKYKRDKECDWNSLLTLIAKIRPLAFEKDQEMVKEWKIKKRAHDDAIRRKNEAEQKIRELEIKHSEFAAYAKVRILESNWELMSVDDICRAVIALGKIKDLEGNFAFKDSVTRW